jgi:hypothetical protein
MDDTQRFKIKNFLKTNLDMLKGKDLASFMEKYDIREAGREEMMMIDMGFPGKFLAFKNEEKGTYFITTYDVMEKILVLEPENVN